MAREKLTDGSGLLETSAGSPLYLQTLDLRDRVLRRPLGLTFHPDDLRQEISHRHFAWVSSSRELLACVVVVPLGENRCKLRQMAVDPKVQGQGVGKALLKDLMECWISEGIQQGFLHARLSAEGFYRKCDWIPVGQVFEEVGLPHIRMEWSWPGSSGR